MSTRARRAVETRRVYRFEELALPELSPQTNWEEPVAVLRRLARRVWATEGRKGQRCPEVVAGRGTPHGDQLVSYCLGRQRIVLCKGQRTVSVLLHELTHALGHGTHGKGFVRRYLDLLVRYGRTPEPLLVLGIGLYGVHL